VERRHVVTVALTAREIAALVGDANKSPSPVAICVTSTDDDHHRVNYAEAALKRFREAVLDQRP
jgi:hypothetical protein